MSTTCGDCHNVTQIGRDISAPGIVTSQWNDRAFGFQCQAVIGSGCYRHYVSDVCRNVCHGPTEPPRCKASVLLQCQTMDQPSRDGDDIAQARGGLELGIV